MEKVKMDIDDDDVLINFTSKGDLAINNLKPWQEMQQRDPWFLQLLIKATIDESDIVLDLTLPIGEA